MSRGDPPRHLAYRPDVDGLRAIAILSVLGYHAFPKLLPGGFVGVDIFFVISGYLITGIILQGLAEGSFTLIGFYARRVRRIFPALIAVLLTIWALGWLKLFPHEYTQLAKHIVAGALYASNFALYRESGYFDAAASAKPLLHLWSLGVEEQFYILWPLLLLATSRVRHFRHVQLIVLAAIACGSFALNAALVHAHPVATFYLPQTRLWELALGGLLAHVQRGGLAHVQRGGGKRLETLLPRWAPGVSALLGCALLGVALATIDKHRPFPGWLALWPTAGTLLLIAAGERPWINRRVLGNEVMVGIGLISYPLYLWHWPLISFVHIIEGDAATTGDILAALAAAFVLATLTYHWVERPLRTVHPPLRPAVPLFIGMLAIAVAGFVTFQDRLAPLSSRYGVQRFLRFTTAWGYPGPRLKPLRTPLGPLLIQAGSPQRILFMGDSNMEQYYPRIDEDLVRAGTRAPTVVFATGGGCPPIPGVREIHHPHCDGLVERALAYASRPSVATVVIGAAWQGYFYDPDPRYSYYFEDATFTGPLTPPGSEGARLALKSLQAMLAGLEQEDKRVYLILQIPDSAAMDPRDMIERGFTTFGFRIDARPLVRQQVLAAIGPMDDALIAIARRVHASVIDPVKWLCGATLCPTIDAAGEPIYRDEGHLGPAYVRESVTFLDALLPPPITEATGTATAQ